MFNKIFGFFGYKVIRKTEIKSLSNKLEMALAANDCLLAQLELKNEKVFNLDGLEWTGATTLLEEIDDALKAKFGEGYVERVFKPLGVKKKVSDIWSEIGKRFAVKRRNDWDANKG